MISVKIAYLGGISAIVRKSEETLRMREGQTMRDLLAKLVGKYGEKLGGLLTDVEKGQKATGRPGRGARARRLNSQHGGRSVIVVRNGEQVEAGTAVEHGDELVMSFPVGGG